MANYVAKAPLFIRRKLIGPGEAFESELPPGRNWEPVDDEARKRCAERDKARGSINAAAARLDPRPAPEAVTIPPDWLEMRPEQVVNLARRLGASGKCNFNQAVVWIENTVAGRTEQPAQMQGAA